MREPSTSSILLSWYYRALSDQALHLPILVDAMPECGFFKTRICKGGPFVPARIYIEQEVCPDTGELLSDEVLKCQVNGRDKDPFDQWYWLAGNPIPIAEFNYMVASADYARDYEPNTPKANPFKKVDWLNVPTPEFT
jgi:hypothetical protein